MSDTNQFQTYRVNVLLKNGDEHSCCTVTQPLGYRLTISQLKSFQGLEWIGWEIANTFFHRDFVVMVEIMEIKQ